MIITIIYQGFDFELKWLGCPFEAVLDVSRIGSLLHPNPFFKEGIDISLRRLPILGNQKIPLESCSPRIGGRGAARPDLLHLFSDLV
jgi:hypothetical protein